MIKNVDFDYGKLSSFNMEGFPTMFQGGDTNIFLNNSGSNSNQQNSSPINPSIMTAVNTFSMDFSKFNSSVLDSLQLLKFSSGN